MEFGAGTGEILEGLGKQLGPVQDGTGKIAHVDEVEGGVVSPLLLQVVDKELDIWGDAGKIRMQPFKAEVRRTSRAGLGSSQHRQRQTRGIGRLPDGATVSGVRLRYLHGQALPKSMAQMPVPHPASKTRFGALSAEMGAVKSRLSWHRMQRLCWRSALDVSCTSRASSSQGRFAHRDGWFLSRELLAKEAMAQDRNLLTGSLGIK